MKRTRSLVELNKVRRAEDERDAALHPLRHRRARRPDDGRAGRRRGLDHPPGAEGPRGRHPPRPRDAEPARGRHHGHDQGQRPEPDRLRRVLADRLARHPRPERRRVAARPGRHALLAGRLARGCSASRAPTSTSRRSRRSPASGRGRASPSCARTCSRRSSPRSSTRAWRRGRLRPRRGPAARRRDPARRRDGHGVDVRCSSAACAWATRAPAGSSTCSSAAASSRATRAPSRARSSSPRRDLPRVLAALAGTPDEPDRLPPPQPAPAASGPEPDGRGPSSLRPPHAGDRGHPARGAHAPADRHLGGRSRDEDPREVPARAGERGVGPAPGPDLRQELPAHVRRGARARRAAARRGVQAPPRAPLGRRAAADRAAPGSRATGARRRRAARGAACRAGSSWAVVVARPRRRPRTSSATAGATTSGDAGDDAADDAHDDDDTTPAAASDTGSTTAAERRRRRRQRAAAARIVRLQIVPTGPRLRLPRDARGRRDARQRRDPAARRAPSRTYRSPRFRLTLGNSEVRLRDQRAPAHGPAVDAAAIGYEITRRRGRTPLARPAAPDLRA